MIPAAAAAADKKPKDALAQFRWGYAAYLAGAATAGQSADLAKTRWVREALAEVTSPASYNYARLRFLIEARRDPDFHLIPLGERLLRQDPKDYGVRYLEGSLLVRTASLEYKQKALAYARTLLLIDPGQPKYHGALAIACEELWGKMKKPEYRDEALREYQEYLRLAPPEAEFRISAQRAIERLGKSRAEQAAKKAGG